MTTIKKYTRIVGVNILVLLVLLGVMEIVLRIFGLNYGNCPLNRDPLLHHTHPKDYTYLSYDIRGEFGGFKVRFDSQGRRTKLDTLKSIEKKSEIWFLGDSYTEACQVCWEETYVGMVESKIEPKRLAVNYGVSGYSPMMYFLLLKNELSTRRPDIVFIQLCENDPENEATYEKVTQFNKQDQPMSINGGETNQVLQLARSSYVVKAIRRAQLVADLWIKTNTRNHSKMESAESTGINKYEVPTPSADSRFMKSIVQINDLLDSMKIEHYFFFIPPKETVMNASWTSTVVSSKFNEYALENGIPHIDMDSTFRAEAEIKPLFFDEDYHCNSNGHAVISEELLKKIN